MCLCGPKTNKTPNQTVQTEGRSSEVQDLLDILGGFCLDSIVHNFQQVLEIVLLKHPQKSEQEKDLR